jgi:pimeloyl-ACP methyl ester carboxylesterase
MNTLDSNRDAGSVRIPPCRTRCGYADTPRGQVHYREALPGAGALTEAAAAAAHAARIVLLHWTPGSSAQYAAILEACAERGIRAVALDLPGLGQSHRREGHWPIGDFADSVLAALDSLGWTRGTILGGHVSSEIALECALRAPQRFELAVLDGVPAWGEELRRSILAKATPAPMTVSEDGHHLTDIWQHVMWETKMWRPAAAFDESLGRFAMGLLRAKILADFDMRPARALLEYDVFDALARVRVPVLALTADQDPLRNCHEIVLARIAGSTGHCFSGEHPIHVPARAAEYLAPILQRLNA